MSTGQPHDSREPTDADRETILITGASGLIGSRVSRLLSEQFNVVGFDLEPPTDFDAGVDFIATDLTKDANVERSIEPGSREVWSAAGQRDSPRRVLRFFG